MSHTSGTVLHSYLTYLYLASRSRVERRSTWAVELLGKYLPNRIKDRPFLVFCLLQTATFVVETVALSGAVFGLLKLATPLVALSLLLGLLLAAGASVGLSTVRRTVTPFDAQRLLVAPIPDRRVYLLALLSGSLEFLDNVVVLPVAAATVASIFFGQQVPLITLWTSVILASLSGFSLALVLDRVFGIFWVRRVQRGVRGASLAGYAFLSTVAFGIGALVGKAIVPWLASAPWNGIITLEELGSFEDSARLVSSLPKYLSEALDLGVVQGLQSMLTHPFFPPGTLARAAMGDVVALITATLGMALTALAAVALWSKSGRWYRSEWQGGWQTWDKGDVFSLAERAYLKASQMLRLRDALLETQIYNLCRRREWLAATSTDLFGGSFAWVWAGLAFGAAPFVQTSAGAAAVFALIIGGAVGNEYGATFLWFHESLAVDAEGRQAGLYRAAGVDLHKLYKTKLLLGRIMGFAPLAVMLLLIALLAHLPVAAWAPLFAAGVAMWMMESQVKLLPSLVSPHFEWDHPDEMADYVEQLWISGRFRRAVGMVHVAQLSLLLVLFAKGYVPSDVFPWAASGLVLLTGCTVEVVLRRISRGWARFIDRKDFLA